MPLPRSGSQQERRQAVSQFQATTGPLRHPSAVAVCRVPSRRLHRYRSVRLPVPYISICASRGDNEACSSCSSSFAPEPAYARGYRLSMRGGGAKAGRAGRAPNVTNALLLSPACERLVAARETLAADDEQARTAAALLFDEAVGKTNLSRVRRAPAQSLRRKDRRAFSRRWLSGGCGA